MQKKLHDNQAVQPGRDIVDHDSGTFRQPFQLPDRRWFHDIEDTKKYKARQKRFPSQRRANQRNQLPGRFIDHYELRIFQPGATRRQGRGGNAHRRSQAPPVRCYAGTTHAPGRNRDSTAQTTTVANEPHVPGPGFIRPTPRNVATSVAHKGAGSGPFVAASGGCDCRVHLVIGVVRIRSAVRSRRLCRAGETKSRIARWPISRDRWCGSARCRKGIPDRNWSRVLTDRTTQFDRWLGVPKETGTHLTKRTSTLMVKSRSHSEYLRRQTSVTPSGRLTASKGFAMPLVSQIHLKVQPATVPHNPHVPRSRNLRPKLP